eukprot:2423454-Rhodomonas_salina.1
MAESVSRLEEEEVLEAERPSRKRSRTQTYASTVQSELDEAKRRSILAANEFLVGLELGNGLGISALCRKHGVKNRTTIYREVEVIRSDPDAMNGIRTMARIAPQKITEADKMEESESEPWSDSETESSGLSEVQRYGKAMAEATSLVSRKKANVEAACLAAQQNWGIEHLNRETVRKRARTHPGEVPAKSGREPIIDPVEQEKLVSLVEAMRAMKIAVYRSTLFFLANEAIKGTKYEKQFPNGKVTRKWFRRFSCDWKHRLRLKNAQKLEMECDKWTTSENIETHYKVLQDLLLELGFTDVNEDYDPTVPYDESRPDDKRCQPIFIKNEMLTRIFSFDETEATTDMSGGSKSFGHGWKEK